MFQFIRALSDRREFLPISSRRHPFLSYFQVDKRRKGLFEKVAPELLKEIVRSPRPALTKK
jgi:hypothetical protein